MILCQIIIKGNKSTNIIILHVKLLTMNAPSLLWLLVWVVKIICSVRFRVKVNTSPLEGGIVPLNQPVDGPILIPKMFKGEPDSARAFSPCLCYLLERSLAAAVEKCVSGCEAQSLNVALCRKCFLIGSFQLFPSGWQWGFWSSNSIIFTDLLSYVILSLW